MKKRKNILVCPFHDWRKIVNEGFRTRDAHVIEHLMDEDSIENLIVINRPITRLEIAVKGYRKNISGEIVLSAKGMCLYRIKPRVYLIDAILNDDLAFLIQRKQWFFKSYGDNVFLEFVRKSLRAIEVNSYNIISHNIYASKLCLKLGIRTFVFDAYDNLLMFPKMRRFKRSLSEAYDFYFNSDLCKIVTNSKTNLKFFSDRYPAIDVNLISNGVDVERFQNLTSDYLPLDLKGIPRPFIGFGGKITHLIDVDLFSSVVNQHPDKSFIILGQVLDRRIFRKLTRPKNVYYLGDKKYSEYSSYVKHFDVAIIPYVTDERDSGANSIKAYEYIAAGLHVVGTEGGGLSDLGDFIYVAKDADDFAEEIARYFNRSHEPKCRELPVHYTWSWITSRLLTLLDE